MAFEYAPSPAPIDMVTQGQTKGEAVALAVGDTARCDPGSRRLPVGNRAPVESGNGVSLLRTACADADDVNGLMASDEEIRDAVPDDSSPSADALADVGDVVM